MNYKVTGTGLGGIRLEYEKLTRNEVINLAVKMGSNGVDDARVFDRKGREIKLDSFARAEERPATLVAHKLVQKREPSDE
jgi:hypothetical protein